MTLFKVIVNGRVIPSNSLDAVAARLVDARGTGATFRVKVVPGFPGSMQERDLTGPEQAIVVAKAAAAVRGAGRRA